MKSNRWWEFYFIRYFVGSVLGSLVVMALAFHPASGLADVIANLFDFEDASLLKLKSDHFWVIFSFGVAFCYIASAPILVMHALRVQLDFQSDTNLSTRAWVFRIVVLAIPLSIAWLLFGNNIAKTGFFSAYGMVVTFQLALLAPAVSNKFENIFNFYKSLAKDRAKEADARKQYIESYRHLREHGNAFLIIFFELVLGSALFVSSSLSEALIAVTFWITPTLTIWLLGTYLESKVNNV